LGVFTRVRTHVCPCVRARMRVCMYAGKVARRESIIYIRLPFVS